MLGAVTAGFHDQVQQTHEKRRPSELALPPSLRESADTSLLVTLRVQSGAADMVVSRAQLPNGEVEVESQRLKITA